MTDDERIAKLEQWKDDHAKVSSRRFDINDTDHKEILSRLVSIETNIVSYKRVVYVIGSIIGMIAGLLVHFWDIIVNKIGH